MTLLRRLWLLSLLAVTTLVGAPECAAQSVDTIISTASGLLGRAEDLAVGLDGTLLVSDGLNHQVHLVAVDGSYLGSVGGAGSGPGEFRVPRKLFPLADGFEVIDAGNSRIQEFAKGGEVVGTRPFPQGGAYRPASVGPNGYIAVNTYGRDGSLVAVFDSQGRRLSQLGVPAAPMPQEISIRSTRREIARGTVPEFFRNTVLPQFDRAGELWLVRPTDGRVERWSAHGTLEWQYGLDEPELGKIRDDFFAAHRDPEGRGLSALAFIADLEATEEMAWVLLNRSEGDASVVVRVSRDGTRLDKRTMPSVLGATLLAVDEPRRRLYLAIPSVAQVVAVPLG